MTEQGGADKRRDWHTQLTRFLLGAATGMAINLFNGASAYRAIAASLAFAAVLSASSRLRRLPARAPIVRYGVWLMLSLGAMAAIIAAVGPPRFAPYVTIGAVGFTIGAVLIVDDLVDRLRMLSGVAVIGAGVGFVGLGVSHLAHREWVLGAAYIAAAIVFIFNAVFNLVSPRILIPTQGVGVGQIILYGVLGAGVGVSFIVRHDVRGGLLLIGFGTLLVAVGVAQLLRRRLLFLAATIGVGLVVAGNSVVSLVDHRLLLAAAGACAGVAMVGLGAVAVVRSDAGIRAMSWLVSLTREPDQPGQPTEGTPGGENPGR